MFLDDSACNLASLNLMKFVGPDGQFDVEAFRHAVDTVILAQEIMVDNASYPTEKIAQEFARFPAAGLGLRQSGRAADVDGHSLRQRSRAAIVPARSRAIMCGQAYLTSARIAEADRARSRAMRRTRSRSWK